MSGKHQLVLVVQGIGDQSPGESVKAFVKARVDHSDLPVEKDIEQIHHLHESPEDPKTPSFDSHVWEIEHNGKKATFAEVYWADISAVRHGKLGTLEGLLQLIFGLHHLTGHAAEAGLRDGQRYWVPHWDTRSWGRLVQQIHRCLRHPALTLGCLAHMIAAVLRGPIAALTLALIVALGVTAELSWLELDHLATLILGVIMAVTSASAWYYYRNGHGGDMRRSVALWLGIFALVLVGLCWVPGWLSDGTLVGMPFETWNETIQFRIDRDAAVPNYGGLWYCLAYADLLVVSLALIPILLLVMAALWAFTAAFADPIARPGLSIAYVGTALSAGLFFLAFPTLAILARELLPEWVPIRKVLPVTSPLLAVWSAAFVVTVAALFTVWRRSRWLQRYPDYEAWIRTQSRIGRDSRPCPLILGGWISLALVILSVAGSILYLMSVVTVVGFMLGTPPVEELRVATENSAWIPLLQDGIHKVDAWISAGIVIGGTLGLGTLMLDKLRIGIDIALDVVNHFRFEWYRTPGNDLQRTAMRKNRVRTRLRTVLQVMTTRFGQPDSLVILAHSQGTVTAIDVLLEPETEGILAGYKSKFLVTMGSPFSHLYQHYFPHEYGSLNDPKFEPLSARIDRWLNLFRVDDYVGTHIDWKGRKFEQHDKGEPWPGTFPKNQALNKGGHTGYWTEQGVHDALDKILIL